MSVVNIGKFNVDVPGRRIFTNEGELPVEPKVIDVLCYLMQYPDRFVSLQELHAEVWSGRVVTDTAVRRTISKLRLLLEDTDPDTPRYIRSQMKRGYQFIYPAAAVTDDVALPDSSQYLSPPTQPDVPLQPKLKRFRIWPLATVLLLVMLTVLYTLLPDDKKQLMVTHQPVVEIAGEKRLLSVSADGRFHTFSGSLGNTGLWQPYLYDFKLGQLQRIPVSEHAVYHLVAMANNNTLAISSFEDGKAKLYLYGVTDLKTPVRTLELNELSDIGQAVPYKDQFVLLNGRRKGEHNGLYYLLDTETAALTQFTYSSVPGSVDFGAVLSPDKHHLALIRSDASHSVQIYRVADKKLIAQESFAKGAVVADELNLMWLNAEELLINFADKHKKLNIQSGVMTALPWHERFTGFGRDAAGNYFGLLLKPQNRDFFQVQLADLTTVQRYFSFNAQALNLSYGRTPGQLWLVEQAKSAYQLFRFFPQTGEKKLSLEQAQPFVVLAETPDYLLLLQQYQLKLLDLHSSELKNISFENQQVHYATPVLNGEQIIFSEQIGDEWLVNIYNRKSNSQSRVLKGYRLLLPWRNQYVASDATGKFYLLDAHYQPIKTLPLTLNVAHRHQVGLYGDKLMTTNLMADGNWALASLNLVTQDYQRQLSSTLPIKSQFSFNNDASSVIITTQNEVVNQLVRLGYNFGYNFSGNKSQ